MSIPDDPFSTDRPPSAPPLSPMNASTVATATPPSEPDYFHADHREGSSQSAQVQTPGGTVLLPPGGSSAPAFRPPRRVQWTSDSHIAETHLFDNTPSSPTRTLDKGNIGQVYEALEQVYTHQRPRRRPPSMISQESSPGEDAIAEDEDYDYRLDIDPPTDNETRRRPSAGGYRGNEENLHLLLDNGVDQHVNNYIPLGETDGLPSIPHHPAHSDFTDAKDLVRAHTGKWGVLRRRVKGAGAVNRAFQSRSGSGQESSNDEEKQGMDQVERGQNAFAARYAAPEDIDEDERFSPNGLFPQVSGMPMGGASVLSSLLALYGQQNLSESGTTSAASSRPPSEDGSYAEEEKQQHVSQASRGRRNSTWFPGKNHSHDTTLDDGGRGRSPLESRPAPPYATHHRSKSASSLVERMERPEPSPGFSTLIKRAKEQFRDADRPKTARSGAGVFGALMVNTANLSGVATPAASALVPAAKRPGYHLSRYSLPDANAPEMKNWRPQLRSRSRSPTRSKGESRPASMHSSTAVSNDTGSPDEQIHMYKHSKSTDIKHEKTKRPTHITLDSLHKLPGAALKEGSHAIKNAEKWIMSGGKTPLITPPEKSLSEYFVRPLTEDERRRKEWETEKKRRKKAKEQRKKQEIFIVQHVAAILARQQFILKLARALMMFGSPSHRLETQIQATAKVLELNAQVVYLPGTMLISFGDDATRTSETKFLKQATGLDLGKLLATHNLYWQVVHDKVSVDDASKELDMLMTTPVYYKWWQRMVIGAMCSAFIVINSYYGSFIDALVAIPLGALLVGVQMISARNDMFSNVFEIVMASVISFLAAALCATEQFCYTALVSGGVVMILPGYIVLTGALELASRNITAGSVRIGYSVIYSLFLGFGISIGAEFYTKFTGKEVYYAADNYCRQTHDTGPWYQVTPSEYWKFLCVPGFSLFMSLFNQQPLWAKELPIMVLFACAGWSANHFAVLAFPNRSDMTSAIGSFVVGTLGHIYGRFSKGSSFPVTVTGIMFQLPSGLANGGIFNFAAESTNGSTNAYNVGFSVAQQLVAVAIGLTVGLFVSAVVTHPYGGGRKRGAGIFSF